MNDGHEGFVNHCVPFPNAATGNESFFPCFLSLIRILKWTHEGQVANLPCWGTQAADLSLIRVLGPSPSE